MSTLIPFDFDGHQLSVVTDENGEVWFLASQLCEILGFSNPRQALMSHVDEDDVQKLDTLTAGGKQAVNHVNESGLYALTFGSTKPDASGSSDGLLAPSFRLFGALAPIPAARCASLRWLRISGLSTTWRRLLA